MSVHIKIGYIPKDWCLPVKSTRGRDSAVSGADTLVMVIEDDTNVIKLPSIGEQIPIEDDIHEETADVWTQIMAFLQAQFGDVRGNVSAEALCRAFNFCTGEDDDLYGLEVVPSDDMYGGLINYYKKFSGDFFFNYIEEEDGELLDEKVVIIAHPRWMK